VLVRRVVLPVLFLAGVLRAEDAAATAERVKGLLAQGRTPGAVQILGSAIAGAQRAGNLLLEQDLCTILREQFASLDPTEDPKQEGGYRDTCLELMRQLDPSRAGACISAHQLAYEIVYTVYAIYKWIASGRVRVRHPDGPLGRQVVCV
jgi:hypothetical protein